MRGFPLTLRRLAHKIPKVTDAPTLETAAAAMKMSPGGLSSIERGVAVLGRKAAAKLADFYGAEVEEILHEWEIARLSYLTDQIERFRIRLREREKAARSKTWRARRKK